jgi:hypothetical protein
MGYLMAILPAMLLAYLAGLLSFKVKSRWCAACGTLKSCPRCAAWASPVGPQGLPDTRTTVEHSATGRGQPAGPYPEVRHRHPSSNAQPMGGRRT